MISLGMIAIDAKTTLFIILWIIIVIWVGSTFANDIELDWAQVQCTVFLACFLIVVTGVIDVVDEHRPLQLNTPLILHFGYDIIK